MTGTTKLPDAPTYCQIVLALRANYIRLTIVTTLYGAPIGRNTN